MFHSLTQDGWRYVKDFDGLHALFSGKRDAGLARMLAFLINWQAVTGALARAAHERLATLVNCNYTC